MVTEIKPGVWAVGVVDYNVRLFHGYTTPYGATYNAYLIVDDKIALIDTCKAPFADELLKNIAGIVDPSRIDYIVCNHAEPDHSGALPAVRAACPHAEIVASAPNGARNLRLHYGDLAVREVKAGDTLSLGARTLRFVPTPMVHWPDNMVTYSPYDRILFSNDAFGEHIAVSNPLDTDNDLAFLLREAKKYYANIVNPYSAQAAKAVSAASALDFDTVCPSHGVVWTKHLPAILQKYEDWTTGAHKEGGAVVAYATMWHSTEKMARAIADSFRRRGIAVRLCDLDSTHPSDIMTDLMTAEYLVVGSSTLNNNLLPQVAGFLTYVKGLVAHSLKGFAFGSYGWSGQSVGQVEELLKACKVEIVHAPVKAQFVPTDALLGELERLEV